MTQSVLHWLLSSLATITFKYLSKDYKSRKNLFSINAIVAGHTSLDMISAGHDLIGHFSKIFLLKITVVSQLVKNVVLKQIISRLSFGEIKYFAKKPDVTDASLTPMGAASVSSQWSFFVPLKKSEHIQFSDVFRGIKRKYWEEKGSVKILKG